MSAMNVVRLASESAERATKVKSQAEEEAEAKKEGAEAGREEAEEERKTRAAAAKSAIERVAGFIPSEIVGAYVGILALFSPGAGDFPLKWGIFLVVLALIPLYIWVAVKLTSKRKMDAGESVVKLGARAWAWSILAPLVAFVTWAGALPDSPFEQLGSLANRIAAAFALILAIFMPKIAELLGMDEAPA